MLFLTFCRIEPQQLKPHRWHWWLLLIQGGVFVLVGLAASACMRLFPFLGSGMMVIAQSFMLCAISPTATAAAVVTRKVDNNHFEITVPIAVSEQFYGWIFGLGKAVRIIGPSRVKEGMKKALADITQRYENE